MKYSLRQASTKNITQGENGRSYTGGRIIRLVETVRLVIRLKYNDGHKMHNAIGRIIFRCASSRAYNGRYFISACNGSCSVFTLIRD